MFYIGSSERASAYHKVNKSVKHSRRMKKMKQWSSSKSKKLMSVVKMLSRDQHNCELLKHKTEEEYNEVNSTETISPRNGITTSPKTYEDTRPLQVPRPMNDTQDIKSKLNGTKRDWIGITQDPITLLIAIIQYLVNTRITNAHQEEEMEKSIHQPKLDDATLRVV